MKKLSKAVDDTMVRMKGRLLRSRPGPVSSAVELDAELECMNKMAKVYRKEIAQLTDRLQRHTGDDPFLAIEDKIAETKATREKLEKEKKRLQKAIKDGGKSLQQADREMETGGRKREALFG